MTVQRPSYAQNLGNVYTAEEMRRVNAMEANRRAGVNATGDFAVSQNGTPNMTVNVAAGEALVAGSETLTQGIYYVYNDAVVNRTIAASDATNPRRDLVVIRVRDQFYSGTFNDADVIVVTGTPAPSPADPAAPANAMILARIAVAANATTITNANITDLRVFQAQRLFPGPNGLHVRNSADTRDNLYMDDSGFQFPSGAISVPPSFGGTLPTSAYGTLPVKIDEQTPSSGTSVTISVPTWARKIQVDWVARTGAASDTLQVQFNGDTAGNYAYTRAALSNTYSAAGASAVTSAQVAFVPGTNTIANSFAGGTFELYTPTATGRRRVWHNRTTRDDVAFGGGGPGPEVAGGNWNNTVNAITSITLFLATGPYVSGCSFVTYAYP